MVYDLGVAKVSLVESVEPSRPGRRLGSLYWGGVQRLEAGSRLPEIPGRSLKSSGSFPESSVKLPEPSEKLPEPSEKFPEPSEKLPEPSRKLPEASEKLPRNFRESSNVEKPRNISSVFQHWKILGSFSESSGSFREGSGSFWEGSGSFSAGSGSFSKDSRKLPEDSWKLPEDFRPLPEIPSFRLPASRPWNLPYGGV